MNIRYVTGDATRPSPERENAPIVIAHCVNDRGGWGAGFVVALSRRWPEVEGAYRRWHLDNVDDNGTPFELGQTQLHQVEPDLWVANIVGQHGFKPRHGKPPIRYDALEQGLERVANFAKDHHAEVHGPRLGAGLAGGAWPNIRVILRRTLLNEGVPVTIYDLPGS